MRLSRSGQAAGDQGQPPRSRRSPHRARWRQCCLLRVAANSVEIRRVTVVRATFSRRDDPDLRDRALVGCPEEESSRAVTQRRVGTRPDRTCPGCAHGRRVSRTADLAGPRAIHLGIAHPSARRPPDRGGRLAPHAVPASPTTSKPSSVAIKPEAAAQHRFFRRDEHTDWLGAPVCVTADGTAGRSTRPPSDHHPPHVDLPRAAHSVLCRTVQPLGHMSPHSRCSEAAGHL